MRVFSMGLSGFSNGDTRGFYEDEQGETHVPIANILRYIAAIPEPYQASARIVHHADNAFGTGMSIDFDGPDDGPERIGDFDDTIRAFQVETN